MADRTALTAGIAVASIAAVVAATPALITAPKNDVQITASAAVAAKTVSADVQLAAFTLAGFLSAFADGYLDPTYAPTATPDGGVPTVSAEAGAIYYTLDNLLPAAFNIDDHFFTSDSDLSDGLDLTNFYKNTLIDLGVSSDIADLFGSLVTNPVATVFALVGLPPEVFDFINSPITTITDALDSSGALTSLITDPITTVINTVAGDLGPVINAFINDPIGTSLHQGGALGDLANAFLNDPIGTTAALIGEDAVNFVTSPVQEIARILAGLLGAQQNGATVALKSASTDEVSDVAVADTSKAPKLFKLDLPTPEKVVSDIESALAPKKKVDKAEKASVETVSADTATDASVAEVDAPTAPKFKLPTPEKAVADFSDNVGKAAKSISDALTPKPKKDKSDASAAADKSDSSSANDKSSSSDSKPDKPKGLGGFGGFKHHEKKAAASAGAAG